MRAGGIDIGSRFIKFVIIEDNQPIVFEKTETGYNPIESCKQILDKHKVDSLVATGYGRYLLEVYGGVNIKTVTEIKAVAKGSAEVFPSCRTVIDIGGQDTKIISLNRNRNVESFEMNDRCAAGTGKFLEIMAKALGYSIEDFSMQCSGGNGSNIAINNMCTVFAESEVISLISRGVERKSIAFALHQSIMKRVLALAARVDVQKDIVFAGGCAYNKCLKDMFENHFDIKLLIYTRPECLAALGAALLSSQLP